MPIIIRAGCGFVAGIVPVYEPAPSRSKGLAQISPGRDLPVSPHPTGEKVVFAVLEQTELSDSQRRDPGPNFGKVLLVSLGFGQFRPTGFIQVLVGKLLVF